MNIENFISDAVRRSVEALYGPLDGEQLQIQKTRREFEGDYTLVTFPLLRRSRKSPEATATEIGEYMTANVPEVKSFNVIKGFLNLTLDCAFWAARFAEIAADANFGQAPDTGRTVMIEYSSPNTNKPLHLGHIRNNLLGYSVAQILRANGHNVIKANLVNDRGIHICKSMLAWKLYGNGETPASSGMKGDHLVGKYYVEFDKHYKAQIKELTAQGQTEEEAKKNAPVMLEAQEMLRKWEAKDPEVYSLWETMNGWVYEGFDVTYKALGVDFDKIYYESQTYLLGKSLVEEGLRKGVFYRRDDNSVWIDLTADGLDEKLLLRGDGTSVYMTQDLGTAYRRFEENRLDDMIYVVGNEQNDLLTLVRMDKNATELNISQVNINNLVEQILKRVRPIAKTRSIEIIFESFRPVTADVDETKLSLAVTNLVENGVKYNNDGGWVRVSVNADHKYFYIKVSDSGVGIPKDAQTRIYERFYRVDKARSRETGGTGLGLAITQNVVQLHHGGIKLNSTPGEGTTFLVRIPLKYIE